MKSYKIFKVIDGLLHFAEVEINCVEPSSEIQIIDLCNGEGWVRQGQIVEVPREGFDLWKSAATKGIQQALSQIGKNYKVELKSIFLLPTDTNTETVILASKIAILKDLNYSLSEKEEELLIDSLKGSYKREKEVTSDFT